MNFVQQIKISQLQISQIMLVGASLSRQSLILRMELLCDLF